MRTRAHLYMVTIFHLAMEMQRCFLQIAVNEKVAELEPFSPVPIYLLMNGSDHLFPQAFTKEYSERMKEDELDIGISSLKNYIENLDSKLAEIGYNRQVHIGEFRSSSRAPTHG